jgi:hypothetical protein
MHCERGAHAPFQAASLGIRFLSHSPRAAGRVRRHLSRQAPLPRALVCQSALNRDPRLECALLHADSHSCASALVKSHERGLCQRVKVQLKPDDGCRCVCTDFEPLGTDGEHGEQVTMRVVARRRTRASVAGRAVIRVGLQRAGRQFRRVAVARVDLKFGHVRRNVDDKPVPEAAPVGASGS